MFTRNRLSLWLLLLLVAIIIIFAGFRIVNRVQVMAFYPGENQHLSSRGQIGITFNQPMDPVSVETRFSLSPQVEGHFFWEGRTLWFAPFDILDPNQTYQATIADGARSQNGRVLHAPFTWTVNVRPAEILYIAFSETDHTGGDLWRYSLTEDRKLQLTDTDNSIFDFAPSPTGDFIVYAKTNPSGGADLWLIDRDGINSTILVNCGLDLCNEPAWSADAKWVAYTRESFSPTEGRRMPARVWTVEVDSEETSPLYHQEEAYGHSPSFSADGKHLATYDSVEQAIRILDLETSQESAIPSVYPDVGDWSPDGSELIFIDLTPGVLEPHAGMVILNIEEKSIRDALGDFIPNLDLDSPRWSPDGEYIAYGARLIGTAAGKGVWVAPLAEGDPTPITNDPSGSFSNYRWDPWGHRLVFQRYASSGPLPHTSLWVWDQATDKAVELIENGARPEWIL